MSVSHHLPHKNQFAAVARRSLDKNNENVVNVKRINITGFNHIFNSQSSTLTRLLWTLLCAVMMGIFIFQCGERVNYFIKGNPIVNTKFDNNATILFPIILICPHNGISKPTLWSFINDSFDNLHDQLADIAVSIAGLWNAFRIEADSVESFTSQHVSLRHGVSVSTNMVEMSDLPTTSGTCWKFKTVEPVPYFGINTFLYIHARSQSAEAIRNRTSHYRVLYTVEEDIPLMNYLLFSHASYNLFEFESISVLRIQSIIRVNSWNKPCVDSSENIRCMVQCIEKKIFSNISHPCRLPYMINSTMRACETFKEFQQMYGATDEVLGKLIQKHDECVCLPKCREIVYVLEYLITGSSTTAETLLRLSTCFRGNKIEVMEEEYHYNFFSLCCDIGGSLGLFVGVCLLQIFDMIYGCFQR